MFDIDKSENTRGFRLSGEFDIAGRNAFIDAIAPEIGRDGDLTLDLSALTFIDSAGVQALIKAAENLKERGRLILYGPGKTVMRVFELMRLDTVPNMDIATGQTPEDERT